MSRSSPAPGAVAVSFSPGQRAWRRFRRNRIGIMSLRLMLVLLLLSFAAPLISNERPILARYHGKLYLPILSNPPETEFGGDFQTPTDWLDPFIRRRFAESGNWALFTFNHYSGSTINFSARRAHPAPPSAENWLGTDDRGRDVFARLLYGFGIGMLFAFGVTLLTTSVGLLVGALQGYFGAWVDLGVQRFTEIWNALPALYLLIILAAIFTPSLLLLMGVFTLFGWISLADYVRAEFLRNRGLEFVKGARALGLSSARIMWRHILPNSLTPVITFLPFRLSEGLLQLTALDFLGLGVPGSVPSVGDLLRQGKDNLDAWWLSLPTIALLVASLLLLTFIGDSLRDAYDTRKS
ncbi:putative oligopeptide transporter subunit; permease component of ABC superfamily transporter [Burkholderiales bacterium]|nr:putative oligopeptide transporter subunit; permease component of ABC superfamily transporter [Burkholderiales bacterium]